jgi:ATP-dependent Clp protease adaptor protein ClpS
MPYFSQFDYDELEDVLVMEDDTDNGNVAYLIVLNDNHNTFDWVIDTFVDVLQHSNEQAEQLALIIHTKGKATVKTATMPKLRPLREAIVERGLKAIIEN